MMQSTYYYLHYIQKMFKQYCLMCIKGPFEYIMSNLLHYALILHLEKITKSSSASTTHTKINFFISVSSHLAVVLHIFCNTAAKAIQDLSSFLFGQKS